MQRALILVILAAVFLAACSEDKIPDDVSLNQPVRDVLNNDLAGGKLVQTFNLGSECFDLRVEYSTEYTTVGWRITDSKTLYMRAEMSNMDPNCNPEVLVEHMHADVSIKSRKEGIDGLKQDSMDDSIHGGLQPGFSIVPPYHYENVFAIEGFSQTLISGWSFYYSGYGGGGINEKRLTEKSLVDDGGACASKFQIVFDLLIRNPGEEAYHTRSVVSEFFVPVPGGNCAALQIAEEKATPD